MAVDDPDDTYFRTTPFFETGHEKYQWLNHSIFVGTGARRPNAVEMSFFEVV
jgi:hypothetical protein